MNYKTRKKRSRGRRRDHHPAAEHVERRAASTAAASASASARVDEPQRWQPLHPGGQREHRDGDRRARHRLEGRSRDLPRARAQEDDGRRRGRGRGGRERGSGRRRCLRRRCWSRRSLEQQEGTDGGVGPRRDAQSDLELLLERGREAASAGAERAGRASVAPISSSFYFSSLSCLSTSRSPSRSRSRFVPGQ